MVDELAVRRFGRAGDCSEASIFDMLEAVKRDVETEGYTHAIVFVGKRTECGGARHDSFHAGDFSPLESRGLIELCRRQMDA